MSDRILVEAVLAGDMGAFATLYRAHVRAVTAAVRDNVHDPESIADVIQEVFLRALERLGTLRDSTGSDRGSCRSPAMRLSIIGACAGGAPSSTTSPWSRPRPPRARMSSPS